MCVQLRALPYARLLKDYHLYVPILVTFSLPNTLLLSTRGERVHGEKVTYVDSFLHLIHLQSSNTIAISLRS